MDRARANIAALRVLAEITDDNRWPTATEQQTLARYSSWGACSEVFDRSRTDWADLRDELQSLVDEDTYSSLRRTTLTAYYTAPDVTRAVWDSLDTAGLTDGPVLEPGAGIGSFIGRAEDTSRMMGVESDPVSAGIAANLYPEATVHAVGYEDVTIPDNSFVAAVGNVPFGNFRMHDPAHNPNRHSIHNHFITKSLNLVQPGGYVAVITSALTADSKSADARQEMAGRADLISGVRLPSQAFRRVAGTDVTTDLLVFRVREPGRESTEQTQRFLETDELELETGEIAVNGYFVDHPDHVLGEPEITAGQFGQPLLRVRGTAEGLGDQITTAISADITRARDTGHGLTATAASVAEVDLTAATSETTPLPGTVSYTRTDKGTPSFQEFSSETGTWEPRPRSRGTDAEEWTKLIDLRETTVSLRQAYTEGDAAEIRGLQQRLGSQYDGYVAQYGYINRYQEHKPQAPSKSAQMAAYSRLVAQWREINGEAKTAHPPAEVAAQFREQAATPIVPDTRARPHIGTLRRDPQIAQVMALELFDNETQTASKAPIFTGNPARPVQPLQRADSVADATAISLDRYGVIDPELVATLTDRPVEDVSEELVESGLAYRDPGNPEQFVRAERYLSGVVESKLETARQVVLDDPRFQANVDALEQALPDRIEHGIEVRPGATWLPEQYYRQFAAAKFGIPESHIRIEHHNDTWTVDVDKNFWEYAGDADQRYGVVAAHNVMGGRYNFSASGKAASYRNQGVATNRNDGVVASAPQMLESVLNLSAPPMNWSKAWREEHPDSPQQHAAASTFAGRKARQMRDEFSAWIMSDPQRRTEVIDRYNQIFNSYVAAKWDGSQRSMPGLGTNFTPYSYQRNAVERIVNEPATLLNHVVGAGKTGTFFMGAAELKRLGKIQQPWIVVPNHLAEQITAEAQEWYPQAKVLSAAGITNAEGRRTFVAQTTAQDWDYVIVPQSVFELVPMSKDTQIEYMDTQIAQLRGELEGSRESGNRLSVKNVESAIANLEARTKALLEADRDVGMEFESTACDYLIVDEAHMYKNLSRASKVDDVSHPGSKRSSDLDMKLSFLRGKAHEQGLDPETVPIATFATGTPLANNLAEIWVMQHYLRPDLLERTHTETINGFAAQFTDQIDDVEVNASGTGLRKVTRTAQFLNVGDLAGLCEPFMDVVTSDQITAALPTRVSGDGNRIIEFDVEDETRDFIADLANRSAKRWDQEFPQAAPRIDNPLKVASDGRKATLHPQLAGLEVPGRGARIDAVSEQILAQWRKHRDTPYLTREGEQSPHPGGLQIVFCDQGTPKNDGRFSVYQAMKDSFVDGGMDPDRIAFIHDWDDDRAELFRRCREGQIDVIVGSTEKLGTGANIQTRATALHHVDVPWRPADLEQREGRIIRQGNQNKDVEVFNYVARGTFDAVQWQTLYRKARFIGQFHTADRSLRQMDAIEESAAEAAAHNKAVATGDHRYVELMDLDKQVTDLESQRMEWAASKESTKYARQSEQLAIRNLRGFIDNSERLLAPAEQWSNTPADQRTWQTPNGDQLQDRARAARATSSTLKAVFDSRSKGEGLPVVSIGGIDFTAQYSAVKSAVVVQPANVPGARGTTFDFEDFDHPAEIPAEADRATAKQYGVLTRLENRVRDMNKDVDLAKTDLTSAETRLAGLSENAGDAFEHDGLLDSTIIRRDELRATLAKVDQSAQAQQQRRERQERLDQHGREPLWTLRLNPTEAYAEEVEHSTVEETIAQAHRDDLTAQFRSGLIDGEAFARQMAQWTPEEEHQDTPETQIDMSLIEDFQIRPVGSQPAAAIATGEAPDSATYQWQHDRDQGDSLE